MTTQTQRQSLYDEDHGTEYSDAHRDELFRLGLAVAVRVLEVCVRTLGDALAFQSGRVLHPVQTAADTRARLEAHLSPVRAQPAEAPSPIRSLG